MPRAGVRDEPSDQDPCMPDAANPTSEPPTAYPVHSVLGIADQPATVETVVDGLADAGVPSESVEIVCGARAKRRLDEFRSEHGLRSRLIKIVQSIRDERDIADRYEHALSDNHFLVVVPAADAEQAQELGEIMKEQGSHFVNYYAPNAITTIAP